MLCLPIILASCLISAAEKKIALKIIFSKAFNYGHLNLGVASNVSLGKLSQQIEGLTGAKKKKNQIKASDIVFMGDEKSFDENSTIGSLIKSKAITKDDDSSRFVLFAAKN